LNKISLAILLVVTCLSAGQIATSLAYDPGPHLEVSISDNVIKAGQFNVVTVTLKNSDQWDLYGIDYVLLSSTPGLIVFSGSQNVVYTLNNNTSMSFHPVLYVDPSILLGAYTLTFQATYIRIGQLISLTVPLSIVISTPFQPQLQATLSPETSDVKIGLRNKVDLQIRNLGENITNLSGTVSAGSPLMTITSGSFNAISLSGGATSQFRFYTDVVGAAQPGSSSFTIQLSYNDPDGFNIRQSLSIPVDVISSQPLLRVTVQPPTLWASKANNVTLKFENIGGSELTNVNASISTSSPTAVITGDVNIQLESLLSGEIKIANTSISLLGETSVGPLTLTGTAYIIDADGNSIRQQFIVPLDVESSSPIIVIRNMNSDNVNYPGDRVNLLLDLECSGTIARNIKIQVIPNTYVNILSPSTVAVDSLAPGEKQSIMMTLDISGSASPGSLPITLNLRYLDSKGSLVTDTAIVTLTVDPIVNLSLSEDVLVSAEQGKTTTLDSNLLLVGTNRIEFAKIEVVSSGPFNTTVGGSEYLGAIDPDSPVPFTVKFTTATDAQLDDTKLHLKVTYLDYRNAPKEVVIDVPVRVIVPSVVSTQTQSDGGIWGWIKSLFGIK